MMFNISISGGNGASVQATVKLSAGDVLEIVVGLPGATGLSQFKVSHRITIYLCQPKTR